MLDISDITAAQRSNMQDGLNITTKKLEPRRVRLFLLAIVLYLFTVALTDREFALSGRDLINAAYGSVLAALIVFVALPLLLYRRRFVLFALFCVGGVVAFALFAEWAVHPMFFAPDDPRRDITLRGFRWGAVSAFVTSFSIAAIVAMFDNLESRRQLSALSELRKEAELASLKSQLNPHIILNTLNNLYSLALDKSEETPDVVLKLSNLLQYSLYEADVRAVPLAREIEILQSYLALQEIGMGERAAIDFEVQGSPDGRRIAPLVLLPLVENAFKHGGAGGGGDPVRFQFQLTIKRRSILFEAVNPLGDNKNDPAAPGGIGLGNLKGRLQIAYPSRHRLLATPDGDTFKAELLIEGEPA